MSLGVAGFTRLTSYGLTRPTRPGFTATQYVGRVLTRLLQVPHTGAGTSRLMISSELAKYCFDLADFTRLTSYSLRARAIEPGAESQTVLGGIFCWSI